MEYAGVQFNRITQHWMPTSRAEVNNPENTEFILNFYYGYQDDVYSDEETCHDIKITDLSLYEVQSLTGNISTYTQHRHFYNYPDDFNSLFKEAWMYYSQSDIAYNRLTLDKARRQLELYIRKTMKGTSRFYDGLSCLSSDSIDKIITDTLEDHIQYFEQNLAHQCPEFYRISTSFEPTFVEFQKVWLYNTGYTKSNSKQKFQLDDNDLYELMLIMASHQKSMEPVQYIHGLMQASGLPWILFAFTSENLCYEFHDLMCYEKVRFMRPDDLA